MRDRPPLSLYAAFAAWLLGTFAYFMPAATWNPVSRFALVRAIVETHALVIDPFAESTGDRALREGHWYSDKAPIPALLAVPAYAAERALEREAPAFVVTRSDGDAPTRVVVNGAFRRGLYACSLATAGLSGVAIGLLLFELLRRRTSTGAALFASAATVLGTPLLPYATSFYGHELAAAFLLGGFVAVHPENSTSAAPWRPSLRIAGACLALAVGSEYLSFVPAALIAAYAVVRAQGGARARAVLHLASGAALPALVVGAYHAACFGAPYRTAYSFIAAPAFAEGHRQGLLGIGLPRPEALAGLLVGGRRGLFPLAPVTLVAAIGLGIGARRRAADDARLAASLLVALLFANAGYYMWWGGAAAGPRHLVPVLPLLAVGIAVVWSCQAARPVVVATAIASVATMLALTCVSVEAPEQGSVLAFAWTGLARGRLALASGASNGGIAAGLVRGGSAGPVFAWCALGFAELWRRHGVARG